MSIDPKKILTEEGWDAVAPDCKGKDKELKRALLFYWTLEDDDFEFRTKALTKIAALAGTLKSAREVTADSDAVKYLAAMANAAKGKQVEVAKAKVEAGKLEAMTQKKAEAQTRKCEEAEKAHEEAHQKDDDETGDYGEKLLAAFKRLKGSSDLEYNFLVCDAKPQCGVVITKQKIGAAHRAELTKVTGGSKRFLKEGTCWVEGGKLVFDLDNAPSGLAAKLKKSLKYFTNTPISVMVGDESDEDVEDERRPGRDEKPEEPPKFVPGVLDEPEKSEKEDATRPYEIGATVGAGGRNKPDDVEATQIALNRRSGAGLTVDGKCGPKTIQAIKAYQKQLGMPYPDGLIEPGKTTEQALRGGRVDYGKAGDGGGYSKGGGGEYAKGGYGKGGGEGYSKGGDAGYGKGGGSGYSKGGGGYSKGGDSGYGKAGGGYSKGGDAGYRKGGGGKYAGTTEEDGGLYEDAKEYAAKVAKELAARQKQIRDTYNEWKGKLEKTADDELGEEGRTIRDELQKAYQQNQQHVQKVVQATKKLVERKTDEAVQELKQAVENTVPGFKTVENLVQQASDWWESD